jgi:hypothetical protein
MMELGTGWICGSCSRPVVSHRGKRWRLWFKRGFVMDLTNGQRVGVAVPEPFGQRWRALLSRGSLPDLSANEDSG